MANATTDLQLAFEAGVAPIYNTLTLESGTTCYEGTVVGVSPTDNTVGAFAGGDTFAGFVSEKAVYANGDRTVQVRAQGIVQLTVTAATSGDPLVTALDIGDSVYASDDQTFTDTATSNMLVGKVHRIISGENTTSMVCMVHFQAASLR